MSRYAQSNIFVTQLFRRKPVLSILVGCAGKLVVCTEVFLSTLQPLPDV